ncbi:Gfo/Idh/MocA family protein [Cohnella sp. WQ 127256]|uniref:Gfo/Idh/MocA family protein n=1 Tax=Cohnella sp. WQ 127256 TaxID=2938790 RepID=UPI00211738DC|nr:Gfo/Idh/MocA family oxidoreductase [Cohnella sp. WQ 127256]
MERKLRYAIIGAGSNAEKKHIKGYLNLPHVEMVAVCDVNFEQAKRVADKYQVSKVYSDYKEMLRNENLDIVSICTPNFLHAEISIAALQAGVNVHCEKPLAVNGNEARQILRVQEASEKALMVGLNNRFTNESVFVKQYIDQGLLGEIYQAKAGWVRRSGIPGRGTWFTNQKLSGGGVMIDLGVHYLDLVLYFMNMPSPSFIAGSTRQTFADTTTRNRNGYKGNPNGVFDVEDSAVGLLHLENGATVSFEFSWASNIEQDKFYYELIGTKGGVSFVNGELKLFSEQSGTCVDIGPKLNPNIRTLDEFQHFTECIATGKQLLAPAWHGEYFMNIVDAFYEAAGNQKPYDFNKTKVGV